MPAVKVKEQHDSGDDEVVMVEGDTPVPSPTNGHSGSSGRQQEQMRQQADDDAEEEEPRLTAAERGLTLETWQDRAVDAQSASQQVRALFSRFVDRRLLSSAS